MTFDNASHDLLLAILNAYEINQAALQVIRSNISNRHQVINLNNTCSISKEIQFGVLQGSVLGPLL